MQRYTAICLVFSFYNEGVWTLKFTLMLRFKFVAQSHTAAAAAAAAEKTTASTSPSRLWIQSYPG